MKKELQKAIEYLKSGNLVRGKELLEDLAVRKPLDPDVLYNLGICYSELNLLDASEKTLLKTIELIPDHANAHTALAFTYLKKGETELSETYLQKALSLEPDNIHALCNLAGSFANQKKYNVALELFKRAEITSPENPRILYGLGLTYHHLGDKVNADKYFLKVIGNDENSEFAELAKDHRREIAEIEFKKHGLRMDAVMYLLSALEKFSNMEIEDVKRVALEISLLGRHGFDTSSPEQKYALKSLPGKYSGLNLVCYLYVLMKKIEPTADIGFDLSNEYNSAEKLYRRKYIE
jgi:tetratricopeptide (TPR) repeat protein